MVRKLTKQKLDAARLLADGMVPKDIAVQLGCSLASVYRWTQDPLVLEEYRQCLRQGQIHAVAKAQHLLVKQMDSDAGNGFLAQNAASLITNKYASTMMGDDKQEITITITSGMPDVGMPERSDEDD